MAKKNLATVSRRVSEKQKIIMVQYMEENLALMNGRFSSDFRAEDSARLWKILADTLNADGIGPQKEVEKWKSTWKDMRLYVKYKTARIKNSIEKTGGHLTNENSLTLTPVEDRILALSLGIESAFEHADETGSQEFAELLDPGPDSNAVICNIDFVGGIDIQMDAAQADLAASRDTTRQFKHGTSFQKVKRKGPEEEPQLHHTMKAAENLAAALQKQQATLCDIGSALMRMAEAKEARCSIEAEKLKLEQEKLVLEKEKFQLEKEKLQLKKEMIPQKFNTKLRQKK